MSSLLVGLTNIKEREIHLIAARLMNIMRALTKQPIPREVVSVVEGSTIRQDVTGEVFDTVWNENAATAVCDLPRFTLTESRTIIDTFDKYAKSIAGGTTRPSLTTVTDIFDHRETRNVNRVTYKDLGYVVDQTTIGDKNREYDFYEFLEELCNLDVVATWYAVYGRPDTVVLCHAVKFVLDIVCELARIADGLTPLDLNKTDYEFIPSVDNGWHVAAVAGTSYDASNIKFAGLKIVCTDRKSGMTQICVVLDKPYRLVTLKNGTTPIEFSVAKMDASKVFYLSDEFYPFDSIEDAKVDVAVDIATGDTRTFMPKTSISAFYK